MSQNSIWLDSQSIGCIADVGKSVICSFKIRLIFFAWREQLTEALKFVSIAYKETYVHLLFCSNKFNCIGNGLQIVHNMMPLHVSRHKIEIFCLSDIF
jgi:hypothetical protein